MWIFRNDSFVSIVAHRERPDDLLVRSRVPDDIERFFAPEPVEIFESDTADYRYRAVVPRARVAAAMTSALEGMTYDNFKNSIRDPRRHTAASRVWQVLADEYGAYGR